MSNKNYQERVSKISSIAGMVTTAMADSQFGEGGLIKDPKQRAQAITDAAKDSPLFEGVEDTGMIAEVATAWGSAINNYANTFGHMPREDLLASCGESLMALTTGDKDSSKMMFESLGGSGNFNSSDGVIIRAKTAALILPVALAAVTNDAAGFVQGGRDKSEFFEIKRVSGSSFGDVEKGQELDEFHFNQFTGMKQVYALPTKPDGTKTRYVVYIYNEATPAEDASALVSVLTNKNPKGSEFIPQSVGLRVNNQLVAQAIEKGQLFGQFTIGGTTYSVTPDNAQNASKGVIAFAITPALPANASITVQYDVNIESGAANGAFPEVTHTMDSFFLLPHQSVLAAQHTIQSYWALTREYGLDVRSMQTSTMRNLLAYEKDVRNLRDMILASAANETKTIPLVVTEGAYFKEKYEELHEHLLQLSNSLMVETRVSGLVGMYAGINVSTIFKALGAPFFVPAPNYRQVPRVHFVGVLFGKWKIFECPTEIEVAGVKLGANDAIGYARGEDFTQAGLLAGDAVPATLYKHGITSNLFNRDTLWELSYGDINPRDGEKFFRKITISK